MECQSNWEYETLAEELTRGMEEAKKLKDNLNSASSEVHDLFLQRILSSFEKSLLLILNWNIGLSVAHDSQPSPPLLLSGPIESSFSVDNSSLSENLDRNLKDQQNLKPCASKKRKTLPTWTKQVKVNSEHGLEGPSNDGYSWRKYGQKDILGAKYPRSYYRCTYRHAQNCWATKHVQRTEDDPTVFDITYKGKHTCYQATNNPMAARSVSPDMKERKHITNNHNSHQLKQQNEMLINFRANLRVNTGESEDVTNSPFVFSSTLAYAEGENQFYHLTNAADETFLGTYSPAFVSPTTPESNYFSISTSYMNSLCGTSNLQHYESDHTGIISASASVTNSPNAALDFPIDSADLDPNFPFTMSSFFT